MAVEQPVELNLGGQLPSPELEGLLHFAIRNSNLTKLREMAGRKNHHISDESFQQLIAAFQESDKVLRDTINRTLVAKDWESEAEFLSGLELVQDYGDHLLDKGDLLDKLHALEPLLDWVIGFRVDESRFTETVLQTAAQLLTDISQNREPTKTLILQRRPRFIHDLYQKIDKSTSVLSEETKASLVLVLNSLIANNPEVVQLIDESILTPLAKQLNELDISNAIFSRLLTTFRVCIPFAASSTAWLRVINTQKLIAHASESNQVSNGIRIVELVELVHKSQNRKPDTSHARETLFVRCVEQNGENDEWCYSLKPDSVSKDEL